MTATSSAKPRKRFRLAAMETLGFLETPFDSSERPAAPSATALVPPRPVPRTGKHVKNPGGSAESPSPILADREPSPTSRRLNTSNIRWTVLFGALLTIAGAASLALWLYQRPLEQAGVARAAVVSDANELSHALEGVRETVSLLALSDVEGLDYAPALLASDAAARKLFASSATIAPSSGPDRAAAADAAGIALDVSRVTGSALAYRLALEPMLIAPPLETDPGLIDVTSATWLFGEWWARLDEVVAALPGDVSAGLSDRLAALIDDLESRQRSYVDAIRSLDAAAASAALTDLQTELDGIRAELFSALEKMAADSLEQLNEVNRKLESLTR
jgi:hypothetical protein